MAMHFLEGKAENSDDCVNPFIWGSTSLDSSTLASEVPGYFAPWGQSGEDLPDDLAPDVGEAGSLGRRGGR